MLNPLQLIEQLDETEKRVLVSLYVDGVHLFDVAQVEGVDPGVVRNIVKLAGAKLQRKLPSVKPRRER